MPAPLDRSAPKRVLAISSQVVRGHIGLSAITPALQAIGHEVWPMPTIVLSNHPGHRHAAGVRTPVERLDAMLDALEANGWLAEVDAVLTGYLPSAEHVAFAVRAIERVRRHNPASMILVDPVLGDDPKGLYIEEAAARAIRDTLVPVASILTPNRFELSWLTGWSISDLADAEAAARALRRPSVVVTSAARLADELATLLVEGGDVCRVTEPFREHVPHGTGDLVSGLLLGHVLHGRSVREAMARSVAGVARAIEASTGHDELTLADELAENCGAQPAKCEPLQ